MDQKKKVIVQEILYWRSSKLLPEHYCQFLLNLYQEGEGDEDLLTSKVRKKESHKKILLSFISTLVILGLIYTVNYFLGLSLFSQGIMFLVISLLLYIISFWLQYKKSDYTHATLGLSSLLLLLATLWMGKGIELDSLLFLLSLIGVLIIWFISGYYFQVKYLVMISIISILLTIGWYFYPVF